MTLKRALHVALTLTPIEYNHGTYMYKRHLNLAINIGIFWLNIKLSFDLAQAFIFNLEYLEKKNSGYFINILEKVNS